MTSDKRKFDNFKSFPGKINEDTDTYEFPTLFTTDKFGNQRRWTVFVRLIKKSSKGSFKKVNWDLANEITIPIKSKYLDKDKTIPDGTIAEVWTESGIISDNNEITRSAPTYPAPTNIGQINYRDHFKQALVLARGKYLKKIDEGGAPANEYGKKLTKHAKYFPMLAKIYEDYVQKHKLKWPVFVQPKLDGVRCISYLNMHGKNIKSADISNVIMYTRKKKEYPNNKLNDNIRRELLPILVKNYVNGESVYLDGELYCHGMKLQDINHYVRKGDIDEPDDIIRYWIYDLFYPSQKIKFEDRATTLVSLSTHTHNLQHICFVETLQIKNQQELDAQYQTYITDGYEGMMIRPSDGLYATSAKGSAGLRSKNLLKRKEVFTDEYEVVDWTQGTAGKEIGAIIWVCQTPKGIRFNVTPNMSYPERYEIYKECKKSFTDTYANRMLTVEFRGKSTDDVPQHAKGIDFRDL